MTRKNILLFSTFTLCLFCISGCEKDKVTDPFSFKIESSAQLLSYLEKEGDIMNTIPIPVLQAEEVYNYLGSDLIIDLRKNSGYVEGHISGSKNIGNDSLFKYVKENYSRFAEVVLVSASGQSAAYYTGLLRLAGFSNVYYMNFGMASWNDLFSSVWTDRLMIMPDTTILYTRTEYPKGKYSPLPQIDINPPSLTMKDFVYSRIDSMIKEGFDESYYSSLSKSVIKFTDWNSRKADFYTICIGSRMLYASTSGQDTSVTYHPDGAILYTVPGPADFRSITYLQTLPSTASIAAYSGSGQESAFYIAYLRLLGYDVKSILFGMNNIDYNMLLHSTELAAFAFQSSNIMNYPYETGQGGK